MRTIVDAKQANAMLAMFGPKRPTYGGPERRAATYKGMSQKRETR